MGHIEEPKGVDFVVGPSVLTEEAKLAISNAIARYHETGEVPESRVEVNEEEGFSKKEIASLKRAYKEALLIRDGKLKGISPSDLWND